MSLTSLLLGSNAKIDTDLDNLFNVQVPTTTAVPPTKKRKLVSSDKDSVKKRLRRDTQKGSQTASLKVYASHSSDIKSGERNSGKSKFREVEYEAENNDPHWDLEDAYASKTSEPTNKVAQTDDSDERDDAPPLHESLARSTKQRTKATKRKHISEDETPEMRDRRTIFVGNLPLEILSKKLLKKQLQRHILAFVSTAKIESIRFRSIPFQIPTTRLPDSDVEGDSKTTNKEARTHAKQRTSNWRANQGEEGVKIDKKNYLTPAQRKKIAYINQEFHTTADVVNAYIVFAHSQEAAERPANLPPLPPTMDPHLAAQQAAVEANGSLFMERVLRVDLVGKVKAIASQAEEDGALSIQGDPRLSIFVGNLDFATKEEDLRAFFEGLMCSERGPPPGQSVNTPGEETSNPMRRPFTWVTRVRIVRDNATQLGRGFSYVEFMDQECVDEVLVMEEANLKFAKRKLRVQRCKTVPGKGVKHCAPQKMSSAKASAEKPGRSIRHKKADVIPKGDPSLGEKLIGLSKEERKQRKSKDPDRLARRLAKKKLRMAMGTVGKAPRKERSRVRSKVKS